MKEKKNILKCKALPMMLSLFAVAGTLLFYAARATWVFVNLTVKIECFTFILLCVMILNCIALGALSAVRVNKQGAENKKAYRVTLALLAVVTVVLFVAGAIFGFTMLAGESGEAYSHYFTESLSDAAFLFLVPALALYMPAFSKKGRYAAAAIAIAITAFIGASQLFPMKDYKITCDPSVLDTGKDYSVVFATNDFGTGYIEYTYEGQQYKLYDHQGGRLVSDSRIHSINVPYEHLDNNTYKVGSVRVVEQYSYGSRTGKQVLSDEYKFTPVRGSDMNCLVISDWHTHTELALESISHLGQYDAVILLGDATPGVDKEQQVVKNIVEFSGTVSGGTKPVLYVRGNHETRGVYAGKILSALGLDEFYYTAQLGDIGFVVLDSGEDKDDSHPEYGGMTSYNAYRSDMIKWLGDVRMKNDRIIALSHSWQISDVEQDLSDKGWAELSRLGVRLMLSGHNHKCRLLGETDREKQVLSENKGITGYLDGGNVDDGADYIASKITVSKKDIIINACNSAGEKVFNHTVKW